MRLFVEEGAIVIMTDVNEELGANVAENLGENATFMKHDVSSKDEWEKFSSL